MVVYLAILRYRYMLRYDVRYCMYVQYGTCTQYHVKQYVNRGRASRAVPSIRLHFTRARLPGKRGTCTATQHALLPSGTVRTVSPALYSSYVVESIIYYSISFVSEYVIRYQTATLSHVVEQLTNTHSTLYLFYMLFALKFRFPRYVPLTCHYVLRGFGSRMPPC